MQLSDLYSISPYEGFPHRGFPIDTYIDWGSDDPGFKEVIELVKPELIIEVGTWKGGSALHMAELTRELNTTIVCVDTWLGSLEFWTDQKDPTRYQALDLLYGYPSVYYQFLANVCHMGYQERIIPFPQTSLIAARWFAGHEIQADMIFVDGSHDYHDVLYDMVAYWPLLRPGGIMFGDDIGTWMDVGLAVEQFTKDRGINASLRGRQWRIQKRKPWYH